MNAAALRKRRRAMEREFRQRREVLGRLHHEAGYAAGYQRARDEVTAFLEMKPGERSASLEDVPKECVFARVAVPNPRPGGVNQPWGQHRMREMNFRKVAFAYALEPSEYGERRALIWFGWVPGGSVPLEIEEARRMR